MSKAEEHPRPPTVRLTLRPDPSPAFRHVPPMIRLRRALKALRRHYGLLCVEAEPLVPDKVTTEQDDASGTPAGQRRAEGE